MLDNGAGLDITEAGTRKSLALYVVRDPADVEGIARLGPDPLADDFTVDVLGAILHDAGRAQIKGVLRHQGNDRRHRQRLLRRAAARREDVAVQAVQQPRATTSSQTLYDAIRTVLGDAVNRSAGLAASELKGEKKSHMAVHGRTGAEVPGVRRHGARGELRRLEPAVLRRPARPAASRSPTGACPSS